MSYYSFENFVLIGHGDYGPIYLVEYKKDGKKYVMKEYKKEKVVLMRSLYSIMNELNIYRNYNTESM